MLAFRSRLFNRKSLAIDSDNFATQTKNSRLILFGIKTICGLLGDISSFIKPNVSIRRMLSKITAASRRPRLFHSSASQSTLQQKQQPRQVGARTHSPVRRAAEPVKETRIRTEEERSANGELISHRSSHEA